MWSTESRAIIEKNIKSRGYHVYVVSGGAVPRWVYTIGLSPRLGCELVFAGGAVLSRDSVLQLIQDVSVVSGLVGGGEFAGRSGEFAFSDVSGGWGDELLRGANDFYSRRVPAVQIVPKGALFTIDVPDLAHEYEIGSPSAWRWLFEQWPFAAPKSSEVMVDTHILHGATVAEAARWETDYWEAFVAPGEEVSKEDARILPLGALVGREPSLEFLTTLSVGSAVRRVGGGEWFEVNG